MAEDRLNEEEPTVKFRPSYSATSLLCPGSLLPSLLTPDVAGYPAAEGTVFHKLITEWQLMRERPDYLLGERVPVDDHIVTVDEDMFTFAEECLRRYDGIPGDRFVEVKVDISSLTPIPNQSGTADLIIVQPGILDIIDWKYGKGIQVFASHNTQLLCYAWGAFDRFDLIYEFQSIRLHIAQPRLWHYDMWEISREQLAEFAVWARRQWAAAWRQDASRYPGPKQCQWCRVRLPCPARQAALERLSDDTFGPIDIEVTPAEQARLTDPTLTFTAPAELSTERLAWIYQYRRSLEVWMREIGEELIRRGVAGEDLGGLWKVVTGRQGNRAWVDDEMAVTALRRLGVPDDALWVRSLASPAQVERLLAQVGIGGALAKRYLDLLTERSPGKRTLAPTDDSRMDEQLVVEQTFNLE